MASPVVDAPLLGVCDAPLDVRKHRSSFSTNKVGGRPDWLPPIRYRNRCCARCSSPLVHVVQVYCPLAASPFHRNIHLFACAAAACGGRADSWTALRSQSLEAADAAGRSTPPRGPPPPATDWCESAEDWGEAAEEDWGAGPDQEGRSVTETQGQETEGSGRGCEDVSVALQRLQVAEAPTDVPALRSFFVSVVEEADVGGDDDGADEHVQELLRDYERREGLAVLEDGGGGGSEEKYEKSCARHGDATFSRFMKKISPCPQQILRYCRGGEPLFISEPPAGALAAAAERPCSACGGPRTFELQLMPALVGLLRDEQGAAAPLEFGTVVVYTCRRSCWRDGGDAALEEACLVQPDPDQQLFL